MTPIKRSKSASVISGALFDKDCNTPSINFNPLSAN